MGDSPSPWGHQTDTALVSDDVNRRSLSRPRRKSVNWWESPSSAIKSQPFNKFLGGLQFGRPKDCKATSSIAAKQQQKQQQQQRHQANEHAQASTGTSKCRVFCLVMPTLAVRCNLSQLHWSSCTGAAAPFLKPEGMSTHPAIDC